MPVTATLRHLRISPRKVRLVARLIRKKKAVDAQNILMFTTKKPAKPLLKLLNSALANAKENYKLNPEELYISKIIVNEGPKLKRWFPVSRGRAHPILKRSSHVTIVLDKIKTE
jgi:large subunit ribosomal protein L22